MYQSIAESYARTVLYNANLMFMNVANSKQAIFKPGCEKYLLFFI